MYQLGRLHAPDERDIKFPMSLALPKEAITITSKYWTTGPVLDQGQSPMCVGYSWEQFLMTTPIRTMNGPTPGTIYHEAQKIDEWPGEAYDGTSVRAGAKYLTTDGNLKSYLWAQNINDIANWVLSSGSVVLGTEWLSGMFSPNSAGLVRPTGTVEGGHAYLCYGYNAQYKIFRLVNSWGIGWAQKGHFWMMKDDMEKLVFGRGTGEACTAIEQVVH